MFHVVSRDRRGAVYLAVLMASLIVSALAMAALTSSHWHVKNLNGDADFRTAQIAADSALEWAVAAINQDPAWRAKHANGVDSATRQLGPATIRYRLIDQDGLLDDDEYDSCTLVVTAEAGDAKYSWQATLEPAGDALNCLQYTVAAKSDVELLTEACWSTDGSFATNGNVIVNGSASLTATCYAAGSYSGWVFGTKNVLVTKLQIPGASVFEPYAASATEIDGNLLPVSGGKLRLRKQLLSTSTNTISGKANGDGLYLIDCKGQDIVISNSRLECTLVLKNAGSNSGAEGALYWVASRVNYPILMVDGDFNFSFERLPMEESSLGVNLNPAGTTFRGLTDATTTTSYPSMLRGLIYVSGRINLSDDSTENNFMGCIVGGEKIRGGADLMLHQRDVFQQDPPPGFRSFSEVRIAAGSIRRMETP